MSELFCIALSALLAVSAHPRGKQLIDPRDFENQGEENVRHVTPVDIPSVNMPLSSTVWCHGESLGLVEWDGLEGRLVKIELYSGDSLVTELSGWSENAGSRSLTGLVMEDWGSGDSYRVHVIDSDEIELWSEPFTVLEEIRVTDPAAGAVFAYGDSFGGIIWSGGSGAEVTVELYHNGEFVKELYEGALGGRMLILEETASSDWEAGSGYQIKVTDPLGGTGWSGEFSLAQFVFLSPSRDVRLTSGDVLPRLLWQGGANLVRLALYRGSSHVCEISDWIDNYGFWDPIQVIEADWQPGSDYSIRIEDVQSSIGWSESFTVYDDTVVVAVEEPQRELFRFGYPEEGKIQVGVSLINSLGEFSDIVSSNIGVEAAYIPSWMFEVGGNIRIMTLNDDAFINNDSLYQGGTMQKIGVFAALRSPSVGGCLLRGGVGYSLALISNNLIIRSEYEGFEQALNSGLVYLIGADALILHDSFVESLYLRATYNIIGKMDAAGMGIGLIASI